MKTRRLSLTLFLVCALFGRAAAQPDKTSPLRQIPYTINTDEVPGAHEILANIGLISVRSSSTVPVTDRIVDYSVRTASGESIAYDIYIPDIKENVVFDAANSVRATAFLDPRLLRWPTAHLIELYKRIDDDPNFSAVVQEVREAEGLRLTDDRLLDSIGQLTQDVAIRYGVESGLIEKAPGPDGPGYRVLEPPQ